MVGDKFGKWLVISQEKHPENRKGRHFLCRCECGYEKIIPANPLLYGKTTQCVDCYNNRTFNYSIGQIIHSWTILDHRKDHFSEMSYLCRCICGNERIIRRRDLSRGKSTQCSSCHIKDKNTTHNLSKSPIYKIWASMMQRCNNPKNKDFKHYGGRGIKVCDFWHDFSWFFNDMGEKPDGLQIDRIDNDGNYEPKNCRWVTAKDNANNKARKKL